MLNKQSGFTLTELLTVIFFLVMVAIGGTFAYVVFHFATKYW